MKFLTKLFKRNSSWDLPKISIVIPCFNAEKEILATLKSIQDSHYQNVDVMVIDDGSEQRAEHFVQSFNDPRFRYFYKENEGPGLTRNFGIDNALGEYIFFLDSDDLIYPDALSNLMDYALAHQLDCVSGVTVRRDINTGVEGEWFRRLYQTKKVNLLVNRLALYDDTLTTNKLYRVEALKQHDIYFETGLYEDKLFTAKLYSKLDRIGLIDNRVYIWLVYGNQTSITTSKSLSNFQERMVAIEKLWQYIPEVRKAYQIAFYMNHDLLIYLREFVFYPQAVKDEIYETAKEFIQKHYHYVYPRLVPASFNRACLDALCEGDKDKFIYTADILSQVFQDEQKTKQRI
ncbi:glycosyltransferase family 2 protein [Conservatibacter flavescens]|uniref:Glycosyltransferase family 2 protein n=1 Tax=Conservatibacter flavescens TaxID=28161 RepID=A0A2M8S4S2_9PAST|nr:glycosyltransferase family 2 protein [Conservatibacter flavescens]PJG86150.1 glycosyltransferase family 2 protein [Conservatibacter flavescens]